VFWASGKDVVFWELGLYHKRVKIKPCGLNEILLHKNNAFEFCRALKWNKMEL